MRINLFWKVEIRKKIKIMKNHSFKLCYQNWNKHFLLFGKQLSINNSKYNLFKSKVLKYYKLFLHGRVQTQIISKISRNLFLSLELILLNKFLKKYNKNLSYYHKNNHHFSNSLVLLNLNNLLFASNHQKCMILIWWNKIYC
jgi:hypothetical protein